MSIVFAVRGTSTTAYFAGGFPSPTSIGTVSITSSTAAGVIGGSYINLDQGALGQHMLSYNGHLNLPATQQYSVLMRCAMSNTASAAQFFYFGMPCNALGNEARWGGAGVVPFTGLDNAGNTLITQNQTVAAAQNQFYDFFWTCDFSQTTNNFLTWRDNTAISTASTGAARIAINPTLGSLLVLGAQNLFGQSTTQLYLNEFVMWNTIMTPSTIALTSGTGLNGSARTAFVQVANSVGGTGLTIRGRPALGPPNQLV
jgi:hypothetical protein